MSLPVTDTRVTYPTGALVSTGTVLHVESAGDHLAVVLDETACHPVDAAWPDQPADTATITFGAGTSAVEVAVTDCVVAASDGTRLYLGADIPVKKGTEGWAFLVAHLVSTEAARSAVEGATARIEVDASTRHALSAGHTGCHLASLALNAALADAWRKEVVPDALGAPDFDALACESSRIAPDASTDRYRIGKSLRRKGFDPAALDDLDALESRIRNTLDGWLDSGAAVRIDREGELLTDRRSWHCELPGGPAVIACGGTHAASLSEFSSIAVWLEREEVDGAVVLSMVSTVVPAG
ncbi:metal-dependent hydrolase [Plantibacter flavus]|uniref:metal-dependent hydrolase n=1 Tax=Plantibacter TaxID=190323 RepID=UPI0010C2231C|nr:MULTISPECIES: metal-dependent hydrolase [Plantibacter]MBD8104488.1 metal-dependent hydrolase [Plantibacter sp. CFBP 8775]TKJ95769.1 metal-dependent hydrolase [Plantibacter flavus]